MASTKFFTLSCIVLSLFVCLHAATPTASSAPKVDPVRDPSSWDRVVSKYVTRGELEGVQLNVVDYMGISNDTDFHDFLEQIKTADVTNVTREEFYAFFINVYNVLAVNMIITNACKKDLFGNCGPLGSIRDIGTLVPYAPVWGKPAGFVAGKEWSLQDVEDYLISPPNNWQEDSRLHAAIVCASISCPNLRNRAYTPENVNESLTDNFNDFISNNKKGMAVDRDSKKVTLSSIFDWFEDNFENKVGPNTGVLDFIIFYLNKTNPDYQFLVQNKDSLSIEHFSYNWDVNAQGDLPCNSSKRPCYQLWALLVTIVALLIVTIVVSITVYCVRRSRSRSGYAPINELK